MLKNLFGIGIARPRSGEWVGAVEVVEGEGMFGCGWDVTAGRAGGDEKLQG
jgi:hypothetical protein